MRRLEAEDGCSGPATTRPTPASGSSTRGCRRSVPGSRRAVRGGGARGTSRPPVLRFPGATDDRASPRLVQHGGPVRRGAHAPAARRDPGPLPQDLERFALTEGEVVSVVSRRGSVQAPVRADPSLRPGLAFMTLHFQDEVPVNQLTIDATIQVRHRRVQGDRDPDREAGGAGGGVSRDPSRKAREPPGPRARRVRGDLQVSSDRPGPPGPDGSPGISRSPQIVQVLQGPRVPQSHGLQPSASPGPVEPRAARGPPVFTPSEQIRAVRGPELP